MVKHSPCSKTKRADLDNTQRMDIHDRVYDAYYGEFSNSTVEEIEQRIDWICSQVTGNVVLDIECNQGISAILLARKGKVVTGIDADSTAIEKAHKHISHEPIPVRENIRFINADATNHSFEIETYDTVIISAVLKKQIHPGELIRLASEKLTSGGRLVVTIPLKIYDYFDHLKTIHLLEPFQIFRNYFEVFDVVVIGNSLGIIAVYKNHDKKEDDNGIINFQLENINKTGLQDLKRDLKKTIGGSDRQLYEGSSIYHSSINRLFSENGLQLKTNDRDTNASIVTETSESYYYKELYQKALSELEDYKGARLKYKRLYGSVTKELEAYKGARLKYKRIASSYEYKYNKITRSFTYMALKNLHLIIRTPSILTKYISYSSRYSNNSKRCIKEYKPIEEFSRKSVFESSKLQDFMITDSITPTTLIYADLDMNIVDGSSIWLSSTINLFNYIGDVVVLSKYNINNDLITSNLTSTNHKRIILEPQDFKISRNLNLTDASLLLIYIDEVLPRVQNLLVRGTEIVKEIVKSNNFKGRLVPYLTNFYSQTNTGPKISNDVIETLDAVSHQAKSWLWQTEEMKDVIERTCSFKIKNHILFPPIIETSSFNSKRHSLPSKKTNSDIIIGYAGKIQPDWGVLELIEETENLIRNGHKIKLRIISSKISWRSTLKSGKGFVEKAQRYLKKNFIEYIEDVNRNRAIELLSDVDYIWSYRDSAFENSTLEISTKLLEGAALGKPVISYPSSIHKKVLGNDYPYFLENLAGLDHILFNNSNNFSLDKLSQEILVEYSLENRIDRIKPLTTVTNKGKLLLSGHDFKFIDHFYSHIKNSGYQVLKDYWNWGEVDLIERSKLFYNNSNIIFCEWGLENAVWYSEHNIQKKPLYIREHLQEINPKAAKFGPKIDTDNVTNIIFVSQRVRDTAIKMWSWDIEKTAIIPNYVMTDDLNFSKERSRPGLNFGIVGITPQRKRLDRAISLLEKVLAIYPKAKLYIKGERPENYEWMHAPGRVEELDYYYNEYKRIENSTILKNAVVFDEFNNDMSSWYKKIDFILSPSDFESFHYALADGVSSGCIPIVWNWEESSNIYTEEWVVSNEEEALRRIENILFMNSTLFLDTIRNNREIIINKYSYRKVFNWLTDTIF